MENNLLATYGIEDPFEQINAAFLRVLFDTCSVVVRKKHLFSEQLPNSSRRTPEERCSTPGQNLPKPAKTGHSRPGYFKLKNSVVYLSCTRQNGKIAETVKSYLLIVDFIKNESLF